MVQYWIRQAGPICKPDDPPPTSRRSCYIIFTHVHSRIRSMDQPGMLTWVNEDPEILPNPQNRGSSPSYRPRAAHTKSRKGCHNCKLRRIKVGEYLPIDREHDLKILSATSLDPTASNVGSEEFNVTSRKCQHPLRQLQALHLITQMSLQSPRHQQENGSNRTWIKCTSLRILARNSKVW